MATVLDAETIEKCKRAVVELVRKPENKYCADCRAKGAFTRTLRAPCVACPFAPYPPARHGRLFPAPRRVAY